MADHMLAQSDFQLEFLLTEFTREVSGTMRGFLVIS